MIEAEYITRNEHKNATEDFVRGSVWAYNKVTEVTFADKSNTPYELLQIVLGLEKTFPDMIAAEKESFEFNRGAEWSFNRFALQVAKDQDMSIEDIMVTIGGFGYDVIKVREELISHQESEGDFDPELLKRNKAELEQLKEIDKTKGW